LGGSTEKYFCEQGTLRYKYGTKDGSPQSHGNYKMNFPYCEKKYVAKKETVSLTY